MKAIRYYGPGDIRLEDIPEPVAGPKQVKIKVAWNGICGSDLHSFYSPIPGLSPTATQPHPTTKETLPITMGHEYSGTIVDIGSEVEHAKFAVGQHVTVEPTLSCLKESCVQCATLNTRNLCPEFACLGVSGGCGGLAEYAVVDDHLAHVLPEGVTLEMGAMMEPLAVAWHAVKKANVRAGCSSLILGAGPVGIMILKILRVNGAGWIGISGRAQKRCELALAHGASAALNVAHPGVDVVRETIQRTGGRGVDVVFDCGGSQNTIDTALASARPGGMIVNVAVWKDIPSIDMNMMMYKEIVLAHSFVYAGDHEELLKAVAQGKFADLTSLITRRIPLEDLVDKGIMALIHEKHDHVKILVHP